MGAGDHWVKASAMYAEGRGFDSCAGTFPVFFFCRFICCAGVDFILPEFDCNNLS